MQDTENKELTAKTEAINEPIIEAYIINNDGELVTPENQPALNELAKQLVSLKELTAKSLIDGSNSDQQEHTAGLGLLDNTNYVTPPIEPTLLSYLLKLDEIHLRCCKTKVTDSIGRHYEIRPVNKDNSTATPPGFRKSREEILSFIKNCNTLDNFEGILEKSGLDYESIGWACIEVIRSADFKVRKLVHVPAEKIRVKNGRKGYVELQTKGTTVHYQLFGEKVLSRTRKNPFTNSFEFFNPEFDGELSAKNCRWNLIDKETGEPLSRVGPNVANELIFIPKYHPSTSHYGVPDVVPAIPYVVANVYIREYFLQFFENNAVPQYAVIIEGGKLSDDVKTVIKEFFDKEVKKNFHRTLIIPIQGTGEVRVRFEKLSADEKEGSFQDTKKNNQVSIMTAHGMSPAIIGITENASLGSGKGLSQAENYKNRIVIPSQLRWANEITKIFRLGLGITTAEVVFDPLDIRDVKEEAEVHKTYLECGVETINEYRKATKIGEPVPGGDRPFIMVGSDIIFVDELDGLKGTSLQKIDNTKKALEARSNSITEKSKLNESKKAKRSAKSPSAEKTGLPVGKP